MEGYKSNISEKINHKYMMMINHKNDCNKNIKYHFCYFCSNGSNNWVNGRIKVRRDVYSLCNYVY